MGSRHVAWILVVALARTAAADDADALTAQGEELARAGEYTRAIATFKRADVVKPSAKHACLIGLVYTRRELWSQAEIFFDRCKQRASTTDPLPDWFDAAATQLAQKLQSADVAEVVIAVEPQAAAVGAQISLSMFPADETFEPRTIHVAPGSMSITARAPGFDPRTETITPKAGTRTQVTLVLSRPPLPSERAPRWPYYVAGGALAAGIAFHVLAVGERDQLQRAFDANDEATYAAHEGTFERDRALAVAGYGLAAVAVAVGVVLRVRTHAGAEVTAAPTQGGVMIGLEVRR